MALFSFSPRLIYFVLILEANLRIQSDGSGSGRHAHSGLRQRGNSNGCWLRLVVLGGWSGVVLCFNRVGHPNNWTHGAGSVGFNDRTSWSDFCRRRYTSFVDGIWCSFNPRSNHFQFLMLAILVH